MRVPHASRSHAGISVLATLSQEVRHSPISLRPAEVIGQGGDHGSASEFGYFAKQVRRPIEQSCEAVSALASVVFLRTRFSNPFSSCIKRCSTWASISALFGPIVYRRGEGLLSQGPIRPAKSAIWFSSRHRSDRSPSASSEEYRFGSSSARRRATTGKQDASVAPSAMRTRRRESRPFTKTRSELLPIPLRA